MLRECPDDDALRQFALGKGTGRRIDEIGDHLDECDRCGARLDAIESEDNDLVDNIRELESLNGSLLGSTMVLDRRKLSELFQRSDLPPECPNCHELLEVDDDDTVEVTCKACGSTVRIDRHQLSSRPPEVLPTLGKFELLESVGQGAFGTVYRARDTELGRTVAIKIPRSGRFITNEDERTFVREAKAAGRLSHPGIVPIFDVGKGDSFPYIVAEFVDGVTLNAAMSSQQFTFQGAAELIASVAEAVHYSHQTGIVHRDLKPSNIILQPVDGERFRPRVMDFGLARQDDAEMTINVEGCIIGTPAYASPEQLDEENRDTSKSSDIYSLGVILYEMLTGERPFRGTMRMLIYQALHDEPRQPRFLNDRIPRDLETICLKCLEKSPERRYASAQELAEDLRRFLAGETIIARPSGRLERVVKWAKRQPVIASLVATVSITVTLLITAATYYTIQLASQKKQLNNQETQLDEQTKQMSKQKSQIDAKTLEANTNAAAAQQEREQASAERLAARYLIDMSLISLAWDAGNTSRVVQILDAQKVKPGGEDPRGFEWYYWWRECHKDDVTLDGHVAGAKSVAVSPDGKRMVVGAGDGVVHCWNLETLQRMRKVVVSDRPVTAIDISSDGKSFVAMGQANLAHLWDIDSGKMSVTFSGHQAPITHVALRPDGKQLLTGSSDGELKLWSFPEGKEIRTYSSDGQTTKALAFAPRGDLFASVALDGTIRLWNSESSDPVTSITFNRSMTDIDFSPDAKRIVVSTSWGQERIALFDVQTGKKLASWVPHRTAEVWAVEWSGFGKIVTGSPDRTMKLWGDSRGAAKPIPIRGHTHSINDLTTHQSGKIFSASQDGTVRVWSYANHRSREFFLSQPVQAVAYSPDGSFVAGPAKGHKILVFKADDRRESPPKFTLEGHTDSILGVAFDNNASRVAGCSVDKTVRVWNLDGKKEAPIILNGHTEAVTSVEFVPGTKRLMSSSLDGQVIIWDLEAGTPLRTFNGHRMPVYYATVSADGKWIASLAGKADGSEGLDAQLIVWDARTLKPRFAPRVFHSNNYYCQSVAFSPDGEKLAAIQRKRKHSILVWNARTGEELHELQITGNYPSRAVLFTPDSRRVAASHLSSITMWDLVTGAEVLVVDGFTHSQIFGLRFSPDGRRLAAATYGTSIMMCDTVLHASMDPAQRERLEREAGRPAAPLSVPAGSGGQE